jgi:predicted transcriptional regulator with HTH domain
MEAEQPLEDLIVIHPHLLQKFMRQGKNFANLLALYTFYNYQAKLQKTNQPLATDQFTKNGMNWAMERVKNTKKILKKMGLITVVQKGYYSYIKLPFIYTKKKVGELLGNIIASQNVKKEPAKLLKNLEKVIVKNENPEPILLKQWLEYCKKNKINYSKKNLSHWTEKLQNRTTIDQKEALYSAMNKKWKNFYVCPIKASRHHQFLGKSLMMEKDCDTLLDIDKRDGRFFYHFKNLKLSSKVEPEKLFNRYGYDKEEVKKAPIVSEVKKLILGMVKRF